MKSYTLYEFIRNRAILTNYFIFQMGFLSVFVLAMEIASEHIELGGITCIFLEDVH